MESNMERFDPSKVSEEVNTRNVVAVIQHANDTRKMMRATEERMDWLSRELSTLREEVRVLTQQVGILRGEVYGGGSTS